MISSARLTALDTTKELADTFSSAAARRMVAASSGATLASRRSVRTGIPHLLAVQNAVPDNCPLSSEQPQRRPATATSPPETNSGRVRLAVARRGDRSDGIHEVRGSIPLSSTNQINKLAKWL